jgi:hypothetical protein
MDGRCASNGARVVDEDVDRRAMVGKILGEGPNRLHIGQIGRAGAKPTTSRLDPTLGFAAGWFEGRADTDDVGSRGGKGIGHREADAPSAPGDHTEHSREVERRLHVRFVS